MGGPLEFKTSLVGTASARSAKVTLQRPCHRNSKDTTSKANPHQKKMEVATILIYRKRDLKT